jgi:hypothetical protein
MGHGVELWSSQLYPMCCLKGACLVRYSLTAKSAGIGDLRECLKNRLGGTKTGLDEVESPLSEMHLSFCARNECAYAYEARRKRG